MSQNNGLKDYTFPIGDADEKGSDMRRSPSLFADSTLSPIGKLSQYQEYLALKMPNEGARKRVFEKEDLKENNAKDTMDLYSPSKCVKYDNPKHRPPTPTANVTLDTLLKEGAQDLKLLLAKWSSLSELENFEKLLPARVDKLLKEAYEYEENLKRQKEKLDVNLQALTRIWKRD